jgi:Family of unknown function (DUF6178)
MSNPKAVRRARRRRVNARRCRGSHPEGARRRRTTPALRDAREPHRLIDRILDAPGLAQAVPRLPPEILHRVIQRCGLEECGEIVALATPGQLADVFDLDVWRAGRPGRDEQFDADRFGVWLEVLIESGAAVAAEIVARLDAGLVTAGLAQHARVFDRAALSPSITDDGDEMPTSQAVDGGPSCDVGGYLLVATRTDSWDAIVAVLMALDAGHHDYFHRVMRGCRRLSNSGFEVDRLHDLLTDREQTMFDVAFDRERRREKRGYVAPAQARAFLEASRQRRLDEAATPPDQPLARAYFRALASSDAAETNSESPRLLLASATPPAPDPAGDAIAAVVDLLLDAGVLPPPPRALLDGTREEAPRLAHIERRMQFLLDLNPDAYSMRSRELAYLANTIVAGCSIQARAIGAQEASDAVVAACNLGLENWPRQWLAADTRRASPVVESGTRLPDDFLVDHDLASVFQVGWTILHHHVCMYTADQLIRILAELRCEDRETRAGLDALRIELARHLQAGEPWRARGALDVVAILDMPAWAALLGLIDECPVIHAGLRASRDPRARAVSADSFEFISENRQIASVREFMRLLPATLVVP